MTTEIHPTQTKLAESTLGMRDRDFYIDCLRSVMIALVCFYKELPSAGTPSSVILTLFTATNQAYIMGILFLLARPFHIRLAQT